MEQLGVVAYVAKPSSLGTFIPKFTLSLWPRNREGG